MRYTKSKEIVDFHGHQVEVEVTTPVAPKRRRLIKLTRTWAQIPHEAGLRLAKCTGNPVLAVLLVLEVAVHKAHSNQVVLTNDLLKPYGITPQSKLRGLRQLAAAGVTSVDWRNSAAPVVTHHWYGPDGKLRQPDTLVPK